MDMSKQTDRWTYRQMKRQSIGETDKLTDLSDHFIEKLKMMRLIRDRLKNDFLTKSLD